VSSQERQPASLDPVAELGQQRRQHGQRAEHGDCDDQHRAQAEGCEAGVAGEEHPGHRDHHAESGDQHRSAGRRGGRLQRGLRAAAGGPFLAFAPEVEHRVVDAHCQPDQQDDCRHVLVDRHQVAGQCQHAERSHHRGQSDQQRDPGGDQRAEREQQDDQGDRHGQDAGRAQVLADRAGDRAVTAGRTDLADEESRVPGSHLLHRGDEGGRLRPGGLAVTRDHERDLRRPAVPGHLVGVAGLQRRGHVPDRPIAPDRGQLVLDHRPEPWIGRGQPRVLNQYRLGHRILQLGGQDPVGPSRLAGAGQCRIDRAGADPVAQHERQHHERQPAERGCLPVPCAPAPHRGRQTTWSRGRDRRGGSAIWIGSRWVGSVPGGRGGTGVHGCCLLSDQRRRSVARSPRWARSSPDVMRRSVPWCPDPIGLSDSGAGLPRPTAAVAVSTAALRRDDSGPRGP
jgi:hypothetical protein